MSPQVRQAIIKTRESMHIDRDLWQNWAIWLARHYLDYAPEEARAQLMGPPSRTSPETRNLVETFAMLYMRAEDRAQAANVQYSLVDLWATARRLQGATP